MTAADGTISTELPAAAPYSPRARHQIIRRLFQRLIVILFIAGIYIPFFGTWFHWDPWGTFEENRLPAAFPAWRIHSIRIKSFVPDFLSFYRDNFGFRNSLIHALAGVNVVAFGISPTPQVVIGTHGWMYYSSPDDADHAKYRGLLPLTESELDGWQQMLESRQAWLAAQGVPYLVMIAPDKETIYSEFMPAALQRVAPSRLDQLLNRLRKTTSPVRFLDLRPPLLKAKQAGIVYWKNDTHWNTQGEFIAYQALMAELQRMLPNRPLITVNLADLEIRPERRVGDLGKLLGLRSLLAEQTLTIMPMKVSVDEIIPIESETDINNPRLPRLVMVHDSFARGWLPLLSRSFSHAAYYYGYNFDANWIASQKPDIVVNEFIERTLVGGKFSNSPAIDQYKLK